jgi:hypothetical protein
VEKLGISNPDKLIWLLKSIGYGLLVKKYAYFYLYLNALKTAA